MIKWGNKIVKNGLIFYLDALNPKSYSTGSIWYDLSGNDYNSTLMLSPTYSNGSFLLNGTNYISAPNNAYFNLTAFTYSAWLKHTTDSLFWDRIVSKKLNYTDSNGWEISLATVSDQTLYIGGSSGTFGTINNITNWRDAKWHHLVVLFNGSTVQVYCDNSYKGQANIATIVSNARDLSIGRIDGEATLTQWRGNMANISMYNRILTPLEISQNFNALKYRYGF